MFGDQVSVDAQTAADRRARAPIATDVYCANDTETDTFSPWLNALSTRP
ncbi:hypothetical protein BCF44_13113 [Kutzneria buriramensis]|uniref:Uncharacterized protein n=1 Tax=Kutzneria buriramensis TaxID=1045776 RepID=A0A3E0GUW6_9PSEU|nr:hypothetical protein BCF44_13113 [Kutzneria buriramensis]